MKKLLFVVIAVSFSVITVAQNQAIDSLKNKIPFTKDTSLVNLYLKIYLEISDQYINNQPDTTINYLFLAQELSNKIGWKAGEAKCHQEIGWYYLGKVNFAKSIAEFFQSLQWYEQEKDTLQIIKCLNSIAVLYQRAEDYNMSLHYCRKVIDLSNTESSKELWQATFIAAIDFYYLDKHDSAQIYFQDTYQIMNRSSHLNTDLITVSFSYIGLGRAFIIKNELKLARTYLDRSKELALQAKKPEYIQLLLVNMEQPYSDLEVKSGNLQAAIDHSNKSLKAAFAFNDKLYTLIAYKQLAYIYEKVNKDSAIKYFKLGYDLRDSIFNVRSKAELASVTMAETERQKIVQQEEKNRLLIRKRNIQYMGIAIGLVTLMILFLLYSRSIIGQEKLIRFLGVFVLLIVFEFINLFLHPYLAHFTGESPLWMLMIMVAIAAILVPSHHNIEKWVSTQLVEKNRKIRLAAAKKTIQQLEDKS